MPSLKGPLGPGPIVVRSSRREEPSSTQQGSGNTHLAFLWQGSHYNNGAVETFPGFIPSLGKATAPKSVGEAFESGYSAATNNYREVAGFVLEDGRSHPQLDADGNGLTSEEDGDLVDVPLAMSIYL